MTISAGAQYTKKELSQKLEFYTEYRHSCRLRMAIIEALSQIPREIADRILSETIILINEFDSGYFSATVIRNRSVLLIAKKDIESGFEAVLSILHEAAHHMLGHVNNAQLSSAQYHQQEDHAWDLVRGWLPPEMHEHLDRAEQLGGGSRNPDHTPPADEEPTCGC